MKTIRASPELKRTILVAVAFAALWVVLAFSRDGVTYHLAPLLVAAVPAAGLGIEGAGTVRSLAAWAVGGATIALAVTFLLVAVGKLDGPSLLPFGGAAAESVIFSIGGAAMGLAVGVWALRADS